MSHSVNPEIISSNEVYYGFYDVNLDGREDILVTKEPITDYEIDGITLSEVFYSTPRVYEITYSSGEQYMSAGRRSTNLIATGVKMENGIADVHYSAYNRVSTNSSTSESNTDNLSTTEIESRAAKLMTKFREITNDLMLNYSDSNKSRLRELFVDESGYN